MLGYVYMKMLKESWSKEINTFVRTARSFERQTIFSLLQYMLGNLLLYTVDVYSVLYECFSGS